MSGTLTSTVADIDTDLHALARRMDACRDLIHRALLDLTSMEYRQDVLLGRRASLQRITDAAATTIAPTRGQR